MRYPPFIAELLRPEHRPKLWMSIRTGYATVALFALLALLGRSLHLVADGRPLLGLVLFKVLTNSASWLALRKDRLVLELGGLNVTADVLCMTGAIYCTGDLASPLFTMYMIEITVVALLTNLGVTLLITAAATAFYAAMLISVHTGWLPRMPPPSALEGARSSAHVLLAIVYATMVLGLPTFYTARLLDALRDKSRALTETNARLVEAGRQKSLFMANITHELRTPIHGINGLSDLVTSGIYGPLNDKQRQAHDNIKRSARSLLQLVDDLLLLARDDAGKTQVSPSDVDLADLLTSASGAARWMLGAKRIDLLTDIEPELPSLWTDRGKLNHIVLNLLSNAIKFTPEGGRICLRARRVDDGVELSVEDTGVGIPEEEQERIFEEFRQIDGSMERRYGGVGLGLALVKRLTALLGGRVAVASSPDQGSRFTVALPLRHEPRSALARWLVGSLARWLVGSLAR